MTPKLQKINTINTNIPLAAAHGLGVAKRNACLCNARLPELTNAAGISASHPNQYTLFKRPHAFIIPSRLALCPRCKPRAQGIGTIE